jgi:hypothetical protein
MRRNIWLVKWQSANNKTSCFPCFLPFPELDSPSKSLSDKIRCSKSGRSILQEVSVVKPAGAIRIVQRKMMGGHESGEMSSRMRKNSKKSRETCDPTNVLDV